MIVTLNGEPREVSEGATVAALVALLSPPARAGRGVAVAVGGEVIPRGEWVSTPVPDGAQVEVVAAIGGG